MSGVQYLHPSYTGGFLEFLLGGMTYPDEAVKAAVVYILVQLCSKTPQNSLPLPIVQSMCRHISTCLATAKSHELTMNLLGLFLVILQVLGIKLSCIHDIVLLQVWSRVCSGMECTYSA